MLPRKFLLTLLMLGAGTSLPAQLMDLSFDVGTRFRQDYVNTDLYFRFDEGTARFDFHFDPARMFAEDDFVRIRITDFERGLVFDERRALDRVEQWENQWYSLGFTATSGDDVPADRRFYENLDFALLVTEGGMDEQGEIFPPQLQILMGSELFAYAWTPMIQYVPPGHGGYYLFDQEASNVTLRFVPVPEPSTYGLAALAMLGAVAGWRRWRAKGFAVTSPA